MFNASFVSWPRPGTSRARVSGIELVENVGDAVGRHGVEEFLRGCDGQCLDDLGSRMQLRLIEDQHGMIARHSGDNINGISQFELVE